jgi:tetratricopeptide (TPR) repeat protein
VAARAKLSYSDDPAGIARRLKEAREAAGLTQRQLSFPGCTPAYISRIEKGERVPSVQILREFARRIGISESYLAHGREERAERKPFIEAKVALRVGDIVTARELIDEGLAAAVNDRERAVASMLYGELALMESDASNAIDALERARHLHPPIEREFPDLAEALGKAYARTADYESSIATFIRSYETAVESQDLIGRIRFGALAANAYADSGNFAAAESILGEVISAADGLTDPLSKAKIFWTQSRMHALRRDFGNAASYAEKALDVLRLSDQGYYLALAHHLLAHIELDRGNVDRALELLDFAQPLIQDSGRPFETANIQLERARALLRSGRRKQAASLAMSTAAVLEHASPLDAGRGYALIGEVFADLGDRERAIELYELAIERLEKFPNRYLVDAYSKLAELLEAEGDSKRAFALLKQAMNIQTRAARPL